MEHHLERSIRFAEEEEYKNLYRWYLQEFAEDGRAIGEKYIPWNWRLSFVATDAHLQNSMECKMWADEPPQHTSTETIHLKLKPYDRVGYAPSFSMFGTSRRTENLSLIVRCLPEASKPEQCTAWGVVKYTSEIDFRDEVQPDAIGFELSLFPKNFDVVRAAVARAGAYCTIHFSAMGVSGMYAEWTPRITTDRVKILTGWKNEQKVEGLEAGELPTLGHIREFNLRVSQSNTPPEVAAKEVDDDDEGEDATPPSLGPTSTPSPDPQVLAELRKLQGAVGKLTLPLWLLIVMLAVALLQRH
jgi:hypothetical protein